MNILSREHSTIFVRWVVSFDNLFRSTVTAIIAIILSLFLRYRRRIKQHPPAIQIKQQYASATLRAKLEFLERVGSRYGYTNSEKGFIDDWREAEFPSLISPLQNTSGNSIGNDHNVQKQTINETVEREVYLDYAGSALPTQSQLECVSKQTHILANPHSIGGGLASDRTYTLMQKVKDKIRVHFGIDDELYFGDKEQEEEESKVQHSEKYQFVFTSGATASLKLVAERFPWSSLTFTSKHDSQILMRSDTLSEMQYNLESIQFQSMLLYPKNVHTSVIGMRSIPLERGSTFHCVSTDELLRATPQWFRSLVDATISYKTTATKIHDPLGACEEKKDEHVECNNISNQTSFHAGEQETVLTCNTIWLHHLLVLPLECNFSGDRFDWSQTVAAARASDFCTYLQCPTGQLRVCHKWSILLDVAKATATSPVDIPNACAPDYAVASFYKMFGYPTGLGILIMKKQPKTKGSAVSEEPLTNSSEELLVNRNHSPRHYFGGGSVDVVLPHKDFVVARNAQHIKNGSGQYVNLGVTVHGTEHFRGIIQLMHGFKELDDLGGMKNIFSHATCLAEELVRRLEKLFHDNGTPVAQIYGQWGKFSRKTNTRNGIFSPGSTVAFNIQDRDGSIIGYDEVSRLASLNNPPIQLRTGCFCNPGACQEALSLAESDVLEQYQSGHVCGDRRGVINGKPTGAIRASFGKDSLWEDMNALVAFIQKVFVSRGEALSLSSRTHLSSHTSSDTPMNENTAVIESLFVFPIKSCAAMRVQRWPIHQSGRLSFDREFALVDVSGSAMRLHSYPRMSEIHPQIDLKTNTLVVSAPHCDDLVLSLNTSSSDDEPITPEDVQVCGVLCKGTIWGGRKASSWFSSILGVRCWLARHHVGKTKSSSFVRGERDDGLAYSNEASLLLVSQNSISALNSVISAQGLGKQVVSRHFRPNIVVSSSSDTQKDTEQQLTSNPEDFWQKICIKSKNNTLELIAVGKCARCQMVDIDPESGMKGNTLRALAEYRRERGKILFGTFFSGNSNNESKDVFWIEEGDEVRAS
jgi:molybdenum cofactor sulfurtransferase